MMLSLPPVFLPALCRLVFLYQMFKHELHHFSLQPFVCWSVTYIFRSNNLNNLPQSLQLKSAAWLKVQCSVVNLICVFSSFWSSCSVVFPLQPINVVAWSPCGQFLAAGSVGGSLNVWDVSSKLCVERYTSLKTVSRTVSNVYYAVWNGRLKAEQSSNGRRSFQLKLSRLCCRQKHEKGFTVCCLAWHPSGSQIAYTDTEGRLGLLDGLGTSNTDTTKVLLRQHSIQTLLLTQLQ